MNYRIVFEDNRCGRASVDPFILDIDSGPTHPDHLDHIAASVFDAVKGLLMSRTVDVVLDADGLGDVVVGGWRPIASFRYTEEEKV